MRDNITEVDVSKYCRICFEEKVGLVSYEKVLVIEDFTCTMEEILQLLSAQEVSISSSIVFNCIIYLLFIVILSETL